MKPETIEQQIAQVGVSADFSLQAALAGPVGAVFRAPAHAPPVPLPLFAASQYEGQGLITLSYDDGLLDNFTHAAPLHLKHRIPANFAVIAKCLVRSATNPRYMTPQMCRVLHDLGFEISSHGLLHCKRLRDMTLKELHQEAYLSKEVIERVIAVPGSVTTYCVPFSRVRSLHVDYLHNVYSVVRQAGSDMNALPLRNKRCVLSHPLTRESSFDQIKGLIDTAIEARSALVLMLHGICPNDARPSPFEVTARLLDQTLEYIAQQGSARLLPVRLSSLRQITPAMMQSARLRSLQNTLLRNMRDTWASLRT
jgi:peptidoglycan/xylan/chitin deacetylase (PgdA/CDA1 family)